MNEWWNNLALREKQTVSIGAIVVLFGLIYFLLWSPLSSTVSNLRVQIKRNQELLSWMKGADTRIETQQHSANKVPVNKQTGSLLSVVQNQINRTQLVSVMTQLHQIDSDSVQLAFQKVDFDKLIVWLTQLSQQQNLTITQMSVTPTDAPGMVTAEFILKT